jgi:hypothetical protein
MKYDFSSRSHDEAPPRVSLVAPLQSFLIVLGGGHPETVRRVAPGREVLDLMIFGLVLLGSMLLTASTITSVLHFAIGDGHFHLLYALIGIVVALVQGTIDNVFQYRRTLHERGCAELRRSGVRLPEIFEQLWAVTLAKLVRVSQGIATGVLGGVCFMLATMAPGTETYIASKYLADNPTLASDATKLVDAGINRSNDDFKAATDRVRKLDQMVTAIRQDDVRRTVRGASRNSGSPTAAGDAELRKLENNLNAESAKRDQLRAALDKQIADRNAAIERHIATAQNAVPKLSGLSGQLQALAALTNDDWKLLIFVIGFQVISLALELGPMWISFVYFPSVYAAHEALQHYIKVTTIGEEGMRQLGVTPPNDPPEPPHTSVALKPKEPPPKGRDPQGQAGPNGAASPRRGPGRPRKVLEPVTGSDDHEQ